MSFMIKKKRFKFDVQLEVEELSSVPFVNGTIFAKVRLISGGSFTDFTSRVDVKDHCVRWESKFKFMCKMIANHNSGILEPCYCRISVRKELKGGKSYQKLGFADVNLSQFAGAGQTTHRYLLDGYNVKRRQDNSTLKLNILMSLLSGDPCFKVTTPNRVESLTVDEDDGGALHSGNKGCDDESESDASLSSSSRFGSLAKKAPAAVSDNEKDLTKIVSVVSRQGFEPCHSRNASVVSNSSKASGYVSFLTTPSSQSPQSSVSSPSSIIPIHHRRTASNSSADPGLTGSFPRPAKRVEGGLMERRLDLTRVNPDDFVDELMKGVDFSVMDENDQEIGLQLVVRKDGSTHLGSQSLKTAAVTTVSISHNG